MFALVLFVAAVASGPSLPALLVGMVLAFAAAFIRPWDIGFLLTVVLGAAISAAGVWIMPSTHAPVIEFAFYLLAIIMTYLMTWVFVSTGLHRGAQQRSEKAKTQNPQTRVRGSSDRQQ